MSTALPELKGFLHEEEEGFVRAFRREQQAARLFSHSPTRGLHITKRKWREISDAGDVKVTMEIPALEGQGGLTITEREIDLPIFTKDLTWGGRAYQAYVDAGLDFEDSRQAGLAMAAEIDEYLYFGGGGKSGTGNLPGPATGLLNDANQLTVDNSASSNWENPEDVRDDLADAVKELLVAGHRIDNLAFLMNPSDYDLFTNLRTNTDSSTMDLLPPGVTMPTWERLVDANTAYLVAVSPDNYDAVGAFAPGQVETITDDPGMEGLRMGKNIWVRHLSSIAPRVKREDCVVKITFDRS